MTIHEAIHKRLVEHGLFDDQAEDIIYAAQMHDIIPEYLRGHHWGEDQTAYPEAVLVGLWLAVGVVAVEWFAANAPKHFARSLFETPATT